MGTLKIVKKGTRFVFWSMALAASLAGSFLLIAGVWALIRGTTLFESDNLFVTSICAVIAWLLTAIFLFGKETILLPVSQPMSFLPNVRRALLEMGYEIGKQSADSLATKHGFQLFFISRGMHIQLMDKQAQITGSKIWVDVLRRNLRVENFLSNPEIVLPEISQRVPGVLLKRVVVQLRIPAEKLNEVNKHIMQVLAKEADVICELCLMAKSDEGIRESTIENQVRPWLNIQGIPAEIHKDLTKMAEPPSSVLLPIRPKGTSARAGIKLAAQEK